MKKLIIKKEDFNMKQEKAIIYCAIEKCPHIFDSTIDYCNNENFNIVNSYILKDRFVLEGISILGSTAKS